MTWNISSDPLRLTKPTSLKNAIENARIAYQRAICSADVQLSYVYMKETDLIRFLKYASTPEKWAQTRQPPDAPPRLFLDDGLTWFVAVNSDTSDPVVWGRAITR